MALPPSEEVILFLIKKDDACDNDMNTIDITAASPSATPSSTSVYRTPFEPHPFHFAAAHRYEKLLRWCLLRGEGPITTTTTTTMTRRGDQTHAGAADAHCIVANARHEGGEALVSGGERRTVATTTADHDGSAAGSEERWVVAQALVNTWYLDQHLLITPLTPQPEPLLAADACRLQTALHAAMRGSPNCFFTEASDRYEALGRHLRILETLLMCGAAVDGEDSQGFRPLQLADYQFNAQSDTDLIGYEREFFEEKTRPSDKLLDLVYEPLDGVDDMMDLSAGRISRLLCPVGRRMESVKRQCQQCNSNSSAILSVVGLS